MGNLSKPTRSQMRKYIWMRYINICRKYVIFLWYEIFQQEDNASCAQLRGGHINGDYSKYIPSKFFFLLMIFKIKMKERYCQLQSLRSWITRSRYIILKILSNIFFRRSKYSRHSFFLNQVLTHWIFLIKVFNVEENNTYYWPFLFFH